MKKTTRENLIEQSAVRLAGQISNAVGFQIDIDTLTGIKARVTEQKFYTAKPSDYMVVEVGQDAFAIDRLTYTSFSTGEDFEAGIIEQGSNDGRLTRADAHVDGVLVPRKFWGRTINYNLLELGSAMKAGNWSIVEAKEAARYKSWMLGIQRTAFLGLKTNNNIRGLLNQADVTSNLTLITKKISDMTVTEFEAFLRGLMPAYFAQTNETAMPTHFVIPYDDFLGLGVQANEGFDTRTKLQRIKEVCEMATGNPDFKVLPLAYGQSNRNELGVERYALYNGNDPESLTFEIPVDYTTTIQDTINGFNWESVGYGQFSSVKAFRPKEMLYFDY